MNEKKWWFGFRQIIPSPPGRGVGWGPYDSYEKALFARERAMTSDCQVSVPFQADSQAEADEKADRMFVV
jgi:hypothetical protein